MFDVTSNAPRRVALAAMLLLAAAVAGQAEEKKAGLDAQDEPKWDVSQPPGDWRSITIDTEETTWSNVDVSPDGRTVVFDMLGDIYSAPIEGGEALALTSGIEWNIQPRFSPDGARIAFISDRGGADNLWLMNADGSEPRAVTKEKEHLVHNPSWSPDGDYIVAKKSFVSTRSIPAGEIWLFHVGGGEGLQLVERPHKEKAQKNIAEPSFSPDDATSTSARTRPRAGCGSTTRTLPGRSSSSSAWSATRARSTTSSPDPAGPSGPHRLPTASCSPL